MTATLPATEPIPIGRARREADATPVITIDGVHKIYGPRCTSKLMSLSARTWLPRGP